MKNRFVFLVALIVAGGLLAFMFTYQVRYDEVAIMTTFDKADENSVVDTAGLHMKLPWPINDVKKFSKRIQLIQDELRQEPTKDNQVLTIRSYMTWQIDDPLKFFITLENTENAHQLLQPILSGDVKTVFTQYDFEQLVNTDTEKIQLAALEKAALENIQKHVSDLGYGITVNQVGIQRLVLPQENTQAVFDRMISVRERMATNARVSGESQAAAIRSQADKAKEQILSFARRRANAIRAKGEDEAAEYYKAFNQEPQLAIFLRRIETIENMNWENSTVLLPSSMLMFQQLFNAMKAKDSVAGALEIPDPPAVKDATTSIEFKPAVGKATAGIEK